MKASEQPPQRRQIEGFPSLGKRQFASFSQVVSIEGSRSYTANTRTRLEEEARLDDKALAGLGLIAMLETPEDSLS